MIKFRIYITLLIIGALCSFSSCSDDDNDLPIINKELAIPSQIEVAIDQSNGIAKIVGVADPNMDVHLKYKGVNGSVLKDSKAEASGRFAFQIDLFIGYDQQFEIYTSTTNKDVVVTSDVASVSLVVRKDKSLGLTNDEVKKLLIESRWKSDQSTSRTLIRQTSTTPPYDMFATVAQKFFDFKASGDFHFEVTTPLQFTHATGSWSLNENGVVDIKTMIPLGPMEIKNIRIQYLDGSRLSLLSEISDGLFLLNFTKE